MINDKDFKQLKQKFELFLGKYQQHNHNKLNGYSVYVKDLTTTNNVNKIQPGELGEYISSIVTSANSLSLSTGTAKTITSINLTAGDWDITGVVDYTFAASTSYTMLQQGSNNATNTMGGQDTYSLYETSAIVPTATVDPAFVIPTVRYSLGGNTTIYLVAKATFTVSTLKAYGTLRARRVR